MASGKHYERTFEARPSVAFKHILAVYLSAVILDESLIDGLVTPYLDGDPGVLVV